MTKIFRILVIFFLASCAEFRDKSKQTNLTNEMNRIGVDTSLIAVSQAIDNSPIWSLDSNFVAANIEGVWRKFDLRKVSLGEADWHQNKIGILLNKNAVSLLKKSEQKNFQKVEASGSVTLKNKIKFEMRAEGFSTSLVITHFNGISKILWSSQLENCHGLAASPDQKFIAYLCEMNGLFVMKTDGP